MVNAVFMLTSKIQVGIPAPLQTWQVSSCTYCNRLSIFRGLGKGEMPKNCLDQGSFQPSGMSMVFPAALLQCDNSVCHNFRGKI